MVNFERRVGALAIGALTLNAVVLFSVVSMFVSARLTIELLCSVLFIALSIIFWIRAVSDFERNIRARILWLFVVTLILMLRPFRVISGLF